MDVNGTEPICPSVEAAFDLMAKRDRIRAGTADTPDGPGTTREAVAVVRIEQLYPWPDAELLATLGRYPGAHEVVWVQEEPENMGAWNFVHGRLHRLLRDRYTLRHVSRPESASPASGSSSLHLVEQEQLLERSFSLLPSEAAEHA